MKIKVTQLDETAKTRIYRALISWAYQNEEHYPDATSIYRDMARRIQHGELILCEYQYNEQEKGGND